MKGPRRADGYALLAALVIVVLAGTFAALCIATVSARQEISGVDRRAATATAAINEGLDDVCDQLRWLPQTRSGTRRSAPGTGSRWAATWRPAVPAAAGTPRLTLDLTSMDARARRSLQAIVELRPEASSQGVVVSGDVDLRAPTTVSGSGFYTGGCLRGRQWLSFTSGDLAAPSAPPRDEVHPEMWSMASVRALGSIWADGHEIHAPGEASERTDDTDTHTPEDGLADLTRAFDPDLLCALSEQAIPPGDALIDGVLDLTRLPARPSSGGVESIVVFVRPVADATLLIVGARSAADCPLVLIVDGDACFGLPDSTPILARGALVVAGGLRVRGPTRYAGHVHAQQLLIDAPMHFEVPRDWREHPLPGLTEPVIVALSGS